MPHPFTIEDYVRWSDADPAGIIFYGAYIRFFEIAETELFRSVGLPYGQLFEHYDIALPRVAVHTEFHYPARLDDRLRVAVYVGRVGTTSLTLNFDVVHLGTGGLAAHGHMVLVCTDRRSFRPQPLPADLVARLEPHTLPTDSARAALGVALPA